MGASRTRLTHAPGAMETFCPEPCRNHVAHSDKHKQFVCSASYQTRKLALSRSGVHCKTFAPWNFSLQKRSLAPVLKGSAKPFCPNLFLKRHTNASHRSTLEPPAPGPLLHFAAIATIPLPYPSPYQTFNTLKAMSISINPPPSFPIPLPCIQEATSLATLSLACSPSNDLAHTPGSAL